MNEFEKEAKERPVSFIREVWDFARTHKKLWMLPLVFALILLGLLVFAGGTGAAPFIYTLF
jgi:hypothetical protein